MGQLREFRSTDGGAPVLSGQVGALIGVLDAVLQDGYNSKTITITRSGNTATATCTSHGFVDQAVLRISGANEADYNGDVRVTRIDADTFTYPVVNSPATPATGTINAIVAPLDWTKPYTGTNAAAYRMPPGTNQFYLDVDDNSDAQNARVRGYESMTAVATGTNGFPTAAQQANGLYWYKSATANSTARAWIIVSDGTFFYIRTDANTSDKAYGYFGDMVSFMPGDSYNTVIGGGTSTGTGGQNGAIQGNNALNYTSGTVYGTYIARSYTGSAGAVTAVLWASQRCLPWSNSVSNPGQAPGTAMTYPAPVIGGMSLERPLLNESAAVAAGPRGVLPGMFFPQHNFGSGADLDYGTAGVGGDLGGAKLLRMETYAGGNYGGFMLQATGDWRAL